MINDNWRKIWQKKTANQLDADSVTVRELLILNGFDVGGQAMFSVAAWLDYVDYVLDKLNVKSGDAVCEIGCGSGAFLYPILQKKIKIAGCDYAENFISICKEIMPTGDFYVAEAKETSFLNDFFNGVVCNSVFHYFPNLSYAEAVIKEIARILQPGGRAAILDVNDSTKEEKYIEYRSKGMGIEQYKLLYKDTPHLFYDKNWVQQTCAKYGLKCEVEDQHIKGYVNTQFRFNAFLEKIES